MEDLGVALVDISNKGSLNHLNDFDASTNGFLLSEDEFVSVRSVECSI